MIGNTNKQTEITTLYLQISESNTKKNSHQSLFRSTYLTTVGNWREFDESMERDGYVWQLREWFLQEVCQDTPQHCLVPDKYNISLPKYVKYNFTSTIATFQHLSVTSEFSEFQNVICIFPTRMELNAPHTYILKSLFAT